MDITELTKVQLRPLSEAVKEFILSFTQASKDPLPETFAFFYAPHKCYLARVDASGKFEVHDHDGRVDIDMVFEARVFNSEKEMRWLKGHGEAIISDDSFPESVGCIPQRYLLWGKSTGETNGNWTKFATARIGSYYVPLSKIQQNEYARFTAIEYLKAYEDGNVAVVDERLTGIEVYKGELNHG